MFYILCGGGGIDKTGGIVTNQMYYIFAKSFHFNYLPFPVISSIGWYSTVPLYFKNQRSDVGRQPTVAGLPVTVGYRPIINELIRLYTGFSTVPACI